jgi:predicted transcriptional regulator
VTIQPCAFCFSEIALGCSVMTIELSEEGAKRLRKMAEEEGVDPMAMAEALIAAEHAKREIRRKVP